MSVALYQPFHKSKASCFVFPFLSHSDRDNLRLVDRGWCIAKRTFEIQNCHEVLKKRIQEKQAVFVKNGQDVQTETLVDVLGTGGSKKAIALQRGRVLMVPNMDWDTLYEIWPRWRRIVYEEVAMSNLLTKMGLLNPRAQRVSLFFSEGSNAPTMPAFLSESFESLGHTQGWFIIDAKNTSSSTWKKGENFLFKAEDDRLNAQNWDSVVDSLLTDIAKISLYGLGIGGDSLNLAILKKSCDSIASLYEIRYFGFDFTHKSFRLDIPQKPIEHPDPTQAIDLLNEALEIVFHYEFGTSYELTSPEREKLLILKNQIITRNAGMLKSRIASLQCIHE